MLRTTTSTAKNSKNNQDHSLRPTLYLAFSNTIQHRCFPNVGNTIVRILCLQQQKPIYLTSIKKFYRMDKDGREVWKYTRLEKERNKVIPGGLPHRWKFLKVLPQTYISSIIISEDSVPKEKSSGSQAPPTGQVGRLERISQRYFQLMYGGQAHGFGAPLPQECTRWRAGQCARERDAVRKWEWMSAGQKMRTIHHWDLGTRRPVSPHRVAEPSIISSFPEDGQWTWPREQRPWGQAKKNGILEAANARTTFSFSNLTLKKTKNLYLTYCLSPWQKPS